MRILLTIALYCFFAVHVQARQVQSPDAFLGHPLGEAFSYHHEVIDYFEYVAQNSDRVKFEIYGKTYERRPLGVAFVSSPENMKRLEEIRKNNLISAGLLEGEVVGKQLPIVWLSYNIHGNEASGTEVAMKVLYDLVAQEPKEATEWLENMVIAIDPCENPDGRERYAQWYNQSKNFNPAFGVDSWEHHEPWPGGRFNHYCFDLNRDWAWQIQQESQARTAIYQKWMPQVHVDLHEMGYDEPYFFPPSAEPFHKSMTNWQREFHKLAGQSHAQYFDMNGWLYFTGKVYDLFYPSYGDTWPTFNGAIGFTYEQGGSGRGGLGVITSAGDTLTLKDRMAHHHASSISTIHVSYQNREKLLEEFNAYFKKGLTNPIGKFKSYVIKMDQNPDGARALLNLLDKQGIEYGFAKNAGGTYKGFDYFNYETTDFKVEAGDVVVSAYQARHRMVDVLFDPSPELSDSLTYDMTAWALPYIYGVQTYGAKGKIENDLTKVPQPVAKNSLSKLKPYGYVVAPSGVRGIQFLADLQKNGVQVRIADEPFSIQEEEYPRGTMVITETGNEHLNKLGNLIIQAANHRGVSIKEVLSGRATTGDDFGNSSFRILDRKPKIAIVNGDGVSSTGFGEVWFYFDRFLNYPTTILNTAYLENVKLTDYDVLVLPSGNFRSYEGQITRFVENGGKLIVLDRAVMPLKGGSLSYVTAADTDVELLKPYAGRERRGIAGRVAGSIFKVRLDESHPLAFGLSESFYLPKRSSRAFQYLKKGWNVGVYPEDSHVAGFVGANLKPRLKNSLAFGTERIGEGSVVYFPDSPTFRGFWHSGLRLMGNAVFVAP